MTIWTGLILKRMRRVAVISIVLVCAIYVSGFGSVSYYFLRNKVLAHLHLCTPDDDIRVAWFSWWPRATALGLYLANPGGTVHLPPNFSETIKSTLIVKGNEVLVFDGPAHLTLAGSAQIIVIPPGSVIGWASALVQITCANAAVDCMTYRMTPYNWRIQVGMLKGFTLQGNGTAASGLHYGDLLGVHIDDVMIENFTSGPGLWADNITGFTERYVLERVSLENNLVGWKLTNSAPDCSRYNSSHSYGRALSVTMRVFQNQTGIEVGPGAYPAHYEWWVMINGWGNNKTYLKLDGPSESCPNAAAMNNGRLTLVADDNGANGGGSGNFVNIAAGASLGGECFLHLYAAGSQETNKIDGSLACQTYLGPTGNQIILDQRTWPSSDTVLHFPQIKSEDTLASLGANQTFAGQNLFGGPTLLYNQLYSLNGHTLTFYSDNFTTPTAGIQGWSGGIYGKSFNIYGGSPGWSGTCPSGHNLMVSGGIVIGCN